MSAETQLYAALSAYAGLSALVSTRIYPDVLPERAAYPAVVFSRERTVPIRSISNHYFGADVAMQIGCWAASRSAADAVAVAVAAALTAAGLAEQGRTAGYDPETDLYATVLELEILEP